MLQCTYTVAADAIGSGACGIHAVIAEYLLAGVPTPIRCFSADAFGTGAA